MKTAIKKYFLLLFLMMFGITGCSTSEKNTKIATHDTPVNTDLPGDKKIVVSPVKNTPQRLSHITDIQTGRYSTVQAKPTQAQRQLLQVMISVTLPDEITTIAQTIHYLLKRSGYPWVQPQVDPLDLTAFFNKRLPEVHGHMGPMTLVDALSMLAAPAFTLHKDPVQRVIRYDLDSRYAGDSL